MKAIPPVRAFARAGEPPYTDGTRTLSPAADDLVRALAAQ
jgi:hypothetical protein